MRIALLQKRYLLDVFRNENDVNATAAEQIDGEEYVHKSSIK